jgi:iron complex transport system ATP-binding protein
LIAARQVGVRRGGRWLVRDVSLEVAAGEVVALLGPNGAGKTTLLRVLSAEEPPDEGEVDLLGRPLQRWPARELGRMRAVLAQSSSLDFGFTVFEVALMGRMPHVDFKETPHDLQIVEGALQAAGVAHLSERIYTTLSGGERQRVQLARVMAQLGAPPAAVTGGSTAAPRLLLLDEPTSNLDVAHQHAALALARQQARSGAAVLAVLHDLNLAGQYADRLALMRDGHLVACGPPAQVLTFENIWRVFEVDTLVVPHPTLPVPLVVTTGSGRDRAQPPERMEA